MFVCDAAIYREPGNGQVPYQQEEQDTVQRHGVPALFVCDAAIYREPGNGQVPFNRRNRILFKGTECLPLISNIYKTKDFEEEFRNESAGKPAF